MEERGGVSDAAERNAGKQESVEVLEFVEIDHGSAGYRGMVELRRRVLRTPLGLEFTEEQLAQEWTDMHIAAYLDGDLVGGLILTDVDGAVAQLRQMVVHPDYQGRGLGGGIVAFAESLATERGYREIVLHARESAIGFYQRGGYVPTGEVFTEVTIPHRTMVKRLGSGR